MIETKSLDGSLFNFIGRLLLSAYFLVPSLYVLSHPTQAQEYVELFGVALPTAVIVGAVLVTALAALLLLLGYWVRLAAAVLFVSLFIWMVFLLLPIHEGGYSLFLRETHIQRTLIRAGGLALLFVVGARRYAVPSREPEWWQDKPVQLWIARGGRWLIGGGYLLMAVWRLVNWTCQSLLFAPFHFEVPGFALLILFGLATAGGLMVFCGCNHQLGCLLLILYSLQMLFFVHFFWDPVLAELIAPTAHCFGEGILNQSSPLLQLRLEFGYLGTIGSLLIYFSCEHPSCRPVLAKEVGDE